MKNIFSLLFTFLLFIILLYSCKSDDATSMYVLPENEHFGELPSAVSQLVAIDSIIEAEFERELKKMGKSVDYKKLNMKITGLKRELDLKVKSIFRNCRHNFVGNTIPFENEASEFHVSDLKISGINSLGCVTLRANLKFKEPAKYKNGKYDIHFLCADKDDNILFKDLFIVENENLKKNSIDPDDNFVVFVDIDREKCIKLVNFSKLHFTKR